MYGTVDWERFTGLNIRSFSAIEVFMKILSHFLSHKCSLFSTIKESTYIHGKTFVILLKAIKMQKM